MNLVLAQMAVPEKTNEITAMHTLVEWLDLEGAIVTIDAMGCQRELAEKIVKKDCDYVLALKENQKNLHDDVESLFQDTRLLEGFGYEEDESVDGGHGRIETRRCRVMTVPEILIKRHDWPGLTSVVEIYSIRELKNKNKEYTRDEYKRYYITSLSRDAKKISYAIRQHWAIENGLHYVLDISFRDDDSRIRKGNAPENIAIIKHAALNLLQKSKKPRESIKGLRKLAAWDETRLTNIFTKNF
jgi:predicted transposase YbfD/YdcC